jgi:hypothetical protein
MRGDHLGRQWRIFRAMEASPNGLTVAEIARRGETEICMIYHGLEALQAAGFPLYTEKIDWTNRWPFIDTFKFKILPPLTLTELMSLYFNRDLDFKALDQALPRYLVGRRAVELQRRSRAA